MKIQQSGRRWRTTLPAVLVLSGALAWLPQAVQAGNTWTGGSGTKVISLDASQTIAAIDNSSSSAFGGFTTITPVDSNDVNLVWTAVPEHGPLSLISGLRRRRA